MIKNNAQTPPKFQQNMAAAGQKYNKDKKRKFIFMDIKQQTTTSNLTLRIISKFASENWSILLCQILFNQI